MWAIEHLSAVPLRDAVRDAGGRLGHRSLTPSRRLGGQFWTSEASFRGLRRPSSALPSRRFRGVGRSGHMRVPRKWVVSRDQNELGGAAGR